MLCKSLHLHAFVQIYTESMYSSHAQIMHLLFAKIWKYMSCQTHLPFASGKYLGRY